MRRKLLIRIARATIPLLRLAVEIVREKAEDTETIIDDALADATLAALDLVEEILKMVPIES
jgi:transcription termination factor NusB